jgi:hypothetical protein
MKYNLFLILLCLFSNHVLLRYLRRGGSSTKSNPKYVFIEEIWFQDGIPEKLDCINQVMNINMIRPIDAKNLKDEVEFDDLLVNVEIRRLPLDK